MGLGNTRAGTEGSDRKEENKMSVENALRQLRDIFDPDDFDDGTDPNDANSPTSSRRFATDGYLPAALDRLYGAVAGLTDPVEEIHDDVIVSG